MINKSKKLSGPFLIDLQNRFREIAGEDQLIDRDEFRNGLQISNEQISDRLFDIFDKDSNGTIDSSEFMNTLESIVNGNKNEKIRFAFKIHDLDNSGFIDRKELKILIKQSFIENNLSFDNFQLELLVEEFFIRADKDKSNTIDFNEFLEVAHDYPDFIEGFAVNPIHWLIPDRYESEFPDLYKSKLPQKRIKNSLQVHDINFFKWLLIPRFIFFYNIMINRKNIREKVVIRSVRLLPSKVVELLVPAPSEFQYSAGDYVYINCENISTVEWYPFSIIRKNSSNELVLHINSNNKWTSKLYSMTLEVLKKGTKIDWPIRLDGPYGKSSESLLNIQHAVMVGAGHGISRMAPILQDIALRIKNNKNNIAIKKLDLHWIIEDQTYFEWFTKLLKDIKNDSEIFNYHIYFLDKSLADFNDKLMYISTDLSDKKTKISLIDNLWDDSFFGLPDWSDILSKYSEKYPNLQRKLFYSGPGKYIKKIKKSCRILNIPFNTK